MPPFCQSSIGVHTGGRESVRDRRRGRESINNNIARKRESVNLHTKRQRSYRQCLHAAIVII
ncbi:MAG: hypothetical protein ACJ72T_08745, partial [Nitrososphaeraceae archaeon]